MVYGAKALYWLQKLCWSFDLTKFNYTAIFLKADLILSLKFIQVPEDKLRKTSLGKQ